MNRPSEGSITSADDIFRFRTGIFRSPDLNFSVPNRNFSVLDLNFSVPEPKFFGSEPKFFGSEPKRFGSGPKFFGSEPKFILLGAKYSEYESKRFAKHALALWIDPCSICGKLKFAYPYNPL